MSEMRRSRAGTFRGVVAALDFDEPDRPAAAARFHKELIRGATDRAKELGFKIESFVVGRRGVSVQRLDQILQSRGIHGVLLLPAWDDPDLTRLDWSRYAGIYADYIIERPPLHSVCSDHYRAMITVLPRLAARGYTRPGLVLNQHHDERLQHRWQGAFLAHHASRPDADFVPPLILTQSNRDAFIAWFKTHKPNVVLAHDATLIDWMTEAGASVPETHGFCCLNVGVNARRCAGIDLQPALLGGRGVELIIAQIYRSEFGVPETPSTTTIPARWVEGPTVRPSPSA